MIQNMAALKRAKLVYLPKKTFEGRPCTYILVIFQTGVLFIGTHGTLISAVQNDKLFLTSTSLREV